MDAILPITYTLIYTFLTKHDHIKAAQALKKAAKHVVELKDGLLSDDPSLDQIVQEWKEFKAHASASVSSSEESSSSSDSEPAKLKAVSQSESDSDSDSDSDSREETEQLRPPTRAKSKTSTPLHSSGGSSDSDSGSESDDESSDAESDKVQKPVTKKSKKRPAEYESSRTQTSGANSSSESGSDDDDDDEVPEEIQEELLNIIKKVAGTNEESTSEESSSDSSSEGAKEDAPALSSTLKWAPAKLTQKAKAKEGVDEERPVKKRKTSEDGEQSIPTGGRNSSAPFKRVDLSKIPSNIVVDNRYENKAGPANDYGHRAHKDLISTRGAGFRKEKNKKKRGSYRGGEITLESHSYKFT